MNRFNLPYPVSALVNGRCGDATIKDACGSIDSWLQPGIVGVTALYGPTDSLVVTDIEPIYGWS